ncbi:MAG TPA: sporulation protein YpjB [Bacillus bacterium]|nr:sporulation protein YpjB [Bacillus sp. (in: firmicutes)]
MVRKIFLPFIFVCLFIPQQIYANNEAWTKLDKLTNHALMLTKQEKYAEAKKMLEQFSAQFIKIYPKEKQVTMNDLRVLSISTDEAIKALTSISLDHAERVRKVTRLHLAIDALHSEYQPLWKEMEKPIIKSFQNMKDAALENDREQFKQQLTAFTDNIDTIYPSLVIALDPDDISRLDSHIRFLETYARVTSKNKEDHLKIMEKDVYNIFGKTITDETDPSFMWVMITTGSIILGALFYVAIKKYRAEKMTIINN